MAQIRLGVGQVNITNYLIAVARKTTTPLVIEAQESYAPPHPATRNVVVPAAGDIDPVIYYVDFYESANGTSFDLLLSQFVYDLKNNIIISERRFYVVDGTGPNDPSSNQDILVDPYLDGKTISGVFKEGFRYLRPQSETIPEWQPHTGGGIELLNNIIFSGGEVYSIEISYLADQTVVSSGGGLYQGTIKIEVDTTLTTTHRNKRLRCERYDSNKLVVTLESVASVPEGTFYHFTSNNGTQNQVKIVPDGSETIILNGENYPELWIGKTEYIRIIKYDGFWEAELPHSNIMQVGERFSGEWKDHLSCKPEDGTLYDGDEWPRIWWWLRNKLPAFHYVVDVNVTNPGYVHPVGFEGQFVIHTSLKKFRVPNGQNLSERGLKNFTTYGTDSERGHDYPGGVQNEMVGPHTHPLPRDTSGSQDIQSLVDTSNADEGITSASQTGNNTGTENRVKNFGVIYLRRF